MLLPDADALLLSVCSWRCYNRIHPRHHGGGMGLDNERENIVPYEVEMKLLLEIAESITLPVFRVTVGFGDMGICISMANLGDIK